MSCANAFFYLDTAVSRRVTGVDKLDLAKQFNAECQPPGRLAPDQKPKKRALSTAPDAVRMRLMRRMKKAKEAKKKAGGRVKAAADAEKAAGKAAAEKKALADAEKETHYTDSRNRKRKRKQLRSISSVGATGRSGRRVFNDTEKGIILGPLFRPNVTQLI